MTLDEAIARLNDKHNHTLVFNPKQLAGFLTELKELREENEKLTSHVCDLQLAYNNELIDGRKAKRLLKAAVEDIHRTYHHRDECCDICNNKQTCTINCAFVWQNEAEALKLIEEEEK